VWVFPRLFYWVCKGESFTYNVFSCNSAQFNLINHHIACIHDSIATTIILLKKGKLSAINKVIEDSEEFKEARRKNSSVMKN